MLLPCLALSITASVLFDIVTAIPDHLLPRQQNAQKAYINASVANSEQVMLQISTKAQGRNETGNGPLYPAFPYVLINAAPLLYGWMIEDINHSIDGGLYAEMISNRAFQGTETNHLFRRVADF